MVVPRQHRERGIVARYSRAGDGDQVERRAGGRVAKVRLRSIKDHRSLRPKINRPENRQRVKGVSREQIQLNGPGAGQIKITRGAILTRDERQGSRSVGPTRAQGRAGKIERLVEAVGASALQDRIREGNNRFVE